MLNVIVSSMVRTAAACPAQHEFGFKIEFQAFVLSSRVM